MAEALLNRLGGRRFRAFSAGSNPTGKVNPLALEALGVEADESPFQSKSWDTFAEPDAPRMDIVITVCDNAAGETCPVWPGAPVTAHWSFPDPAAVEGSENDRLAAFLRVHDDIEDRIEALVTLPVESLDAKNLQGELEALAPHY